MNKSIFIWCLLLSSMISPIAIIAQIDWNSPAFEIGNKEGLTDNYIKDIIEDAFGFTWIATFSEIYRFDGIELIPLQNEVLPTDGFTELIYDAVDHKIWIGTLDGIYTYNLIDQTVAHFSLGDILSNDIIALDRGRSDTLWAIKAEYLIGIDMRTNEVFNRRVEINKNNSEPFVCIDLNDVCIDGRDENYIWLATGCGILQYDIKNNDFNRIDESLEMDRKTISNDIFYEANTEQIIVGYKKQMNQKNTLNYSIIPAGKYDPQKPNQEILFNPNWSNNQIHESKSGEIIFSLDGGTILYDLNQHKIKYQYNIGQEDLPEHQVHFKDSKNRLWVSLDQSIKVFRPTNNQSGIFYYKTDHPKWYHVNARIRYAPENNSILMAVYGADGLYEFDLNSAAFKLYPALDQQTGEVKKSGLMDAFYYEGALKGLAHEGLYSIKNDRLTHKPDELISGTTWVNSYKDQLNFIWAFSRSGIIKYDLTQDTAQKLPLNIHFCKEEFGSAKFFEDRYHNIWITGMCGGFDMYHRIENRFYSFDFPENDGSNTASGIAEHNGYVWAIGDYGNLYQMDPAHPEDGILKSFFLNQKLSRKEIDFIHSNDTSILYCNGLSIDANNHFWILSKSGVLKYDTTSQQIEKFDSSSGLEVIDKDIGVYVANNLISLPDGRMVYGTRKAIVLFNPLTINTHLPLPKPFITNVTVNNEDVISDTSAFLKYHYNFKPNENFIGFDFSAISENGPENLSFQYMLIGEDETWKNPRDKRFVSYSKLSGGEYIFKLKAGHSNGNWNNTPAVVHFTVAKKWYETWLVRISFLVGVGGILFGIYYSRLKRAVEKEKLKTQYEKTLAELKMKALTAQMNPHFIFNSLNSIDYYIIKNDTLNASQYLNRFSRLMRLILKNSTSNFITLQDDLDALQLYLEIESLRFDNKFQFSINIDPAIDSEYVRIPPMLIQPYVENSIWHGLLHKKENGSITVNAKLGEHQDKLLIEIIDNGIGRNKSIQAKQSNGAQRKHKSFGMNITKDKISTLNLLNNMEAKVEIIDLYNSNKESVGTKVQIILPI